MRSGMSKDIIKQHQTVYKMFFFFHVCIKMGNKSSENVCFQKLFITCPHPRICHLNFHFTSRTLTSSQSLPKAKTENWGDTRNQREEDLAGPEESCLNSIKWTAIWGKIGLDLRWQQQERNGGLEGEPNQQPKCHPSDCSALKHPSLPQSCQLTASLSSS